MMFTKINSCSLYIFTIAVDVYILPRCTRCKVHCVFGPGASIFAAPWGRVWGWELAQNHQQNHQQLTSRTGQHSLVYV